MQLTRSRPAAPSRHTAASNGHAPAPPRRDRGRLRRATVLMGRIVLWTAILALAVRGGVATLAELDAKPPAAVQEPQDASPEFPVEAARAFATRFTHDYLTYDPADDSRSERLAAYSPGGRSDDFGWDGRGVQTVRAAVAVSVTVSSSERATVVVAAQVNGRRWLHLAVPIIADRAGRLAVPDTPTLVAAPPLAALPPPADPPGDPALSRDLQPVLASFFDAYAAGRADDLAYYLPVGREIEGLDGTVELDELVDVWVAESGAARHAQATVRWRDTSTGAVLTQRYELRLVDSAGRWYVDGLGAAAWAAEEPADAAGQDPATEGGRDDR